VYTHEEANSSVYRLSLIVTLVALIKLR